MFVECFTRVALTRCPCAHALRYLLNYGFSLEENERHDGSSPNEVALTIDSPAHATPHDSRDSEAAAHLRRRKAAVWGPSAVRLPLSIPASASPSAPSSVLVPERWPVLGLLRFLAADGAETARLAQTAHLRSAAHLRPLLNDNSRSKDGDQGGERAAWLGALVAEQPTSQPSEQPASKPSARDERMCQAREASRERREQRKQRKCAPKPATDDPFGDLDDDLIADHDDDEEEDEDEDDEKKGGAGSLARRSSGGPTAEALDPLGSLAADPAEALSRLAGLPPLSAANEARTWAMLADLCAAALAKYPADLSTDPTEAEAKHPRFSNAWNAAVQTAGERRILRFWRDAAAARAGTEMAK